MGLTPLLDFMKTNKHFIHGPGGSRLENVSPCFFMPKPHIPGPSGGSVEIPKPTVKYDPVGPGSGLGSLSSWM